MIAIVILYLLFKDKITSMLSSAPPTGAAAGASTGAAAAMSSTPSVSQPAAVSQPSDVSQPAAVSQQPAISSVGVDTIQVPHILTMSPSVFSSGTSDAQLQGSNGTVATAATAAQNLPSGFQTWLNSLGPLNKAHVVGLVSAMTSDEINFVDSLVTQNLWGQQSVQAEWNDFVTKYGLPIGAGFNSFSGGKRKPKFKKM